MLSSDNLQRSKSPIQQKLAAAKSARASRRKEKDADLFGTLGMAPVYKKAVRVQASKTPTSTLPSSSRLQHQALDSPKSSGGGGGGGWGDDDDDLDLDD